jgi:hypothetical protein
MDRLDKGHKINVAYDLIKRVAEDTNEELWAYEWLSDALVALEKWFEEEDY